MTISTDISLRTTDHTNLGKLPKAVVFDRDGVLIRDVGYAHRLTQLHWTDGALKLLEDLKRKNVLVLVASNQSGIARGMFTADEVERFHAHLVSQAQAAGGSIAHIEYCPHLPHGTVTPFNIECTCRKPGVGMLLSLSRKFSLNPADVILIGDRDTDMLAASSAGVRGALFPGGDLYHFFWNLYQ